MTRGYRRLWLLVEGNDDARFVESVLAPKFRRAYDDVQIWRYSQAPIRKRANFLQNIRRTGADYILFCDIDELPCVTSKKESMKSGLPALSDARIAVVVKEIESWYLAGLDESDFSALGIANASRPDEVVKEKFDVLVGGKANHTDMMVEILKRYDISQARRRSPSFGYFARKHLANPRAT